MSTFQGRAVLECWSTGMKNLGTRLKRSLITEGHLFMFYFFVAEIIYRLLMRRSGCLASTVVT